MAQTETYGGSVLRVSTTLPVTEDAAGWAAVTDFIAGECALHEVPMIARTWDAVREELVCKATSKNVKGGASWDDITFKLSRKAGDAAQAIYEALENDTSAIGSFELELAGSGGKFYFTAQVAKFSLVDGGSRNTLHTSTVQLFIQSDDIFFIPAP